MSNLFKIQCDLYNRPDIYRKVKSFYQEINKYTILNETLRSKMYNIDSIKSIEKRNIEVSKIQSKFSKNNDIIFNIQSLIIIEKQKIKNLQTQALVGIEPRPKKIVNYKDNSDRKIYYNVFSRTSSGNRTY